MATSRTDWTVRELRAALDAKEVSAIEVAAAYQQRIADTNDELNSFITVTKQEAERAAAHAQAEIDAGNQGLLTGVPYAAKDLFCTRGVRTTAASRILADYVPPYTATAVERLGDAVLLGKTNMDEFGMGSSTEFSAHGPGKNPYDLTRVPGGSSGGSAAAVAAGQVPFALGTDTGGSVRQPASFCGVVGLKPTYGRISRYGVIAYASSFDTVGTFTRTVEDAAVVLGELAGPDGFDATAPDQPIDDYVAGLTDASIKGLRIGVPKEYMEADGFDGSVRDAIQASIDQLAAAGAEIVEVSLPNTQYAVPAYYVLVPAEASSNLSRYDGMQFGQPAADTTSIRDMIMRTRDEGFGDVVKERILVGTFSLSSGQYDAYYHQAQQARTVVRRDFDAVFEHVDLLYAPASPFLPFAIGERSADPLKMYAADIFTIPVSLAGLPTVSLPVGVVDGLPVGAQLIGPHFTEARLLAAAHAAEQVFGFEAPSLAV